MIIALVVLSIVFIAQQYLTYIERKEWREERQKLLDRIQARDYVEYKKMEIPVEKKEDEKPRYEYV